MTRNQGNELEIAMNLLRQAAQKEQRTKLIVSVGMTLAGIALLVLFFEKNTALSIVGLLFLFFGIQFGYQYFRYREVDKMPIFNVLKYRPKSIVWVYSVVTERMPFGFKINQNALMYFKLINGDTMSISVPSERAEMISAGLNYLLPQASFGYTEDREQWFMAAPEMLLRDENDV
ncbi:MAG: hypothetical protein AAF849_16235 [Bacteroidota bacterium]